MTGMCSEGRDGQHGNGDGTDTDAGSSLSPSILHCISSGVGVLAVRGGGRSQDQS